MIILKARMLFSILAFWRFDMVTTLEKAKSYLRVDSSDDDEIIEILIKTAERMCKNILRSGRGCTCSSKLELAVLYAVAYLYEHREEADHRELMLSLRGLLSQERREVF